LAASIISSVTLASGLLRAWSAKAAAIWPLTLVRPADLSLPPLGQAADPRFISGLASPKDEQGDDGKAVRLRATIATQPASHQDSGGRFGLALHEAAGTERNHVAAVAVETDRTLHQLLERGDLLRAARLAGVRGS
jgi:hypothetical protein